MAAPGSSNSNVEMNEKIDLDEIPATAGNGYILLDSDPEAEKSPRYDPFILAAQSGSLDDFRKAIDMIVRRTHLLHDAARGEHLEVIRLLLDVGASPKMTNNRGKILAMLVRTDLQVRSILDTTAAAENGD